MYFYTTWALLHKKKKSVIYFIVVVGFVVSCVTNADATRIWLFTMLRWLKLMELYRNIPHTSVCSIRVIEMAAYDLPASLI